MSLTHDDLAAIAAMLDSIVDSKLAAVVPVMPAPAPTPAPAPAPDAGASMLASVLAQSLDTVVLESSDTTVSKGWTPEQLASDATDPQRNAYTPVVRAAAASRKVDSEYYRLYEPLWRAEKARLAGLGVAHAGKQAQVNFAARLKLERERLAVRDGGVVGVGRVPVIGVETRRSSGTHSDPTANIAVGNVMNPDKAARMAALQAQMDALDASDDVTSIASIRPAKSLTRVAAQKRAGTNPYEASLAILVAAAKASDDPIRHIKAWLADRKVVSPKTVDIDRSKAVKACERLGIQVKG